jgi:UDP:flavonoid glycosyltransferase YjiC (YdhE family)
MGDSRKRILFFAEGATMAHFVRPLALALSLDPSRYQVRFLSPSRFAPLLTGCNFATAALDTMPGERFLANLATGSPLFPTSVIRKYVLADREAIAAFRPRLVVGDMRPSLSLSARLEAVPSAILINAYWSPYAQRRSILPELPLTRVLPPRFLTGIYRLSEPLAHAYHARPINTVRREFGLPPLPPDLRTVYTDADWVLYPEIPEFIPTPGRSPNHLYIGACAWTAPVEKPPWWDAFKGDPRPIVFVSLGSSGPLRVLPALIQALGSLPVGVVVATSSRDLAGLPASWYVAPLLPFTQTARLSSVVISHGGSGGLYPALAAGVPVLGIPSNADQHLSTAVLAGHHAGLGVRVEEASPRRLRRAIDALLNDPAYTAAARHWAQKFAGYDTGSHFRAFLDRALGGAEPPLLAGG